MSARLLPWGGFSLSLPGLRPSPEEPLRKVFLRTRLALLDASAGGPSVSAGRTPIAHGETLFSSRRRPFLEITCTQCAAQVEVVEGEAFAFCPHCDSSLFLDRTKVVFNYPPGEHGRR
jgi:DNA-directed RNA polymerase subunit RPC12/RpoP